MADVRCPNCKGPLKEFRDLKPDEIPAAEAAVSKYPGERAERFRPQAYHRCTAPGCRRIQRKDNWQVGANLPEGF
ncbi:hypothetical protein [Streptomyces sp. NPDC008092]|uniref:hypothetical protein n=1 Tax=Streptomyces sp. NPDC008092 TaxID=3364808 RepID=UPI0036F034EE